MGLTTSFSEADRMNIREIRHGKYVIKYINDCVDSLQDQLLSEILGSATVGAELMLIVISDAEMAWQRNILWVLFVQEVIAAVAIAILFYVYQRLSHMARYVNGVLKIETTYSISQ